jgi:hypothetical protein
MPACRGIIVNGERGEVTGVANRNFRKESGQNGNFQPKAWRGFGVKKIIKSPLMNGNSLMWKRKKRKRFFHFNFFV